MSAQDNPQAFPVACPPDFQFAHDGMTLLDYYAGKALEGILAGGFADTIPHDDVTGGADVAFFAFNYAEAMLQERERRLKP